jgi:hypothetical protein
VCSFFFFNLDSIYERKHAVFVFLRLTYFSKYVGLQFHPCFVNNMISFFYDWIILHCVYIYLHISHFLYQFIFWWASALTLYDDHD